jgi:hypothetical protein
MAASASDVRAGGAFYQLSCRDDLSPSLARIQKNATVFSASLAGLNPGAGGTGFLNRLVFGAKEFDAQSKQYLGRVGGLLGPVRAALDPGPRGGGAVNEFLFGRSADPTAEIGATTAAIVKARGEADKFRKAGRFDLAAKADLNVSDMEKKLAGLKDRAKIRVDTQTTTKGLDLARAKLAAAQKAGQIDVAVKAHLEVGDLEKRLNALKARTEGEYKGRVGGLLTPLRSTLDSGAGGSGLVNRFVFGEKQLDAKTGEYMGRLGGIAQAAGALKNTVTGAFGAGAAAAESLGSALLKVGAGLTGLGGAALAPLAALFKGGIDRAADLDRLSRRLGVNVELLNKMQYAAQKAGVSIEEVMQDETGRYRADIAAAPSIDPRDAKAAAESQQVLAEATRSLQDALLPLVSALTPYLKLAADWVKTNAHLIAPLLPLAAGVTALGAAVATAGALVAGVAGGLAAAIGAIAAAPEVLAGIAAGIAAIGATAGSIVAVGAAFLNLSDTGGKAAEVIEDELTGAFETGKSAYVALANALKKGDLETAGKVATTSLELLWADLMVKFQKGWRDFKGYFVDGWQEITGGLAAPLREVWTQVAGFFDEVYQGWKWVGKQLWSLGESIWEAIREPVMKVVKFLESVFAAIALPFLAAVGVIELAWENLDKNIVTNLINLGAWVEKTYAGISISIENAFKGVARTAVDTVIAAANKLRGLDPTGFIKEGVELAEKLKTTIPGDRSVKDEQGKIIAERDSQVAAHQKERADAAAKRQGERDQDVSNALDTFDGLKKDLAAFTAKANEPRAPIGPDGNRLPPIRPDLLGQINVKGGFSGAALGQQFGVSDQALRANELLNQLVLQGAAAPQLIGTEVGKAVAPLNPRIGR